MINPRVQKVPKEVKEKLCGFFSLFHKRLQLAGHQRVLDQQRIIRILTGIQVSHLLLTIIDISKKSEVLPLQELRIGVIGCGVIGRMIVNDLIPLSKAGLQLENVAISTRQPQNIAVFQRFGIELQYDNQKVASNSDILIIATPATLDNWILIEIGKAIKQKRLKKQSTNERSKSPLIFVLTSGVNEKALRSYFGEQCQLVLPYENFQGMVELFSNQEQLWSIPNQSLNESLIQQRAFKSFEKNKDNLAETLSFFFQQNGSSIEQNGSGLIHQHLQSPSLIDNYLQKYKRLKDYSQGL